jgi:hypothetical protein
MNIIRWLNSFNARRAAAPRPTRRAPALRGWEQLEDRVVPSAASDALAAKLYGDLLNRPATPGEAALVLQAGSDAILRQALALQNTTEWANQTTNQVYQASLNRIADQASLAFWSGLLRTQSVEQVQAAILASPEFYQRSGGTNAGFVAGLYKVLLQRNPDAAGLSYYTQALDSGTSRETVALQFLTSTEYRVLLVYDVYERFLGRAPEAAGLQNWVEYLADGGTRQGLVARVAASPEYTAPPPPPAPPAVLVNVTAPASRTNANGAVVTGVAVTATGTGTGPIFYTATNLPPGLGINPLTGVISGTISSTGSNTSPHNVTVTASQNGVTDSASFTWIVTPGTMSTLPFSLIDDGWVTLPSGTRYKDVTIGTGAAAVAGGNITVNYTGFLTDGTVFDSGTLPNAPLVVPTPTMSGLIQGWVDAVPGMKVGGVRLLDIPSARAYGSNPQPGIPLNSELVFRIELTGVS